MSKKSRRVAICLITDSQDRILMGLRNDCKLFTTPGGHLEDGEDPYQGCLRELQEETMLDADDIQLVKTKYVKEKNLMLYLFRVEVNSRQMADPSNDPDNEVEFWDYVDPNDVKAELHVPLEENVALQYWMDN